MIEDPVEEARQYAMEAVDHHCNKGPLNSAWDLAGAVGKANKWTWCKKSINGKEYAAMVIMIDKLSRK